MEAARETGSGSAGWRVAPVHAALAVTSLAAAGIHFAVMGEHFEEYFLFGLFFSLLGWFQGLWALGIVVSPSRRMLVAGLGVNALVVVIWVVSRTSGLPFGPEPGAPEPVAFLDVLSTLLELVIVVTTTALLRRGRTSTDRKTPEVGWNVVTALVLVLMLVSTLAVASAGEHGHGDSATRCLRSGATRTPWCFTPRNGWSPRMQHMDNADRKKMQGGARQDVDHDSG